MVNGTPFHSPGCGGERCVLDQRTNVNKVLLSSVRSRPGISFDYRRGLIVNGFFYNSRGSKLRTL